MYRRTVRRGLGSASITSIQSLITSVANQFNVPPSIALAVAQKESGFNQAAVGQAGEVGVFQLMPATAAGLQRRSLGSHPERSGRGGPAGLAVQAVWELDAGARGLQRRPPAVNQGTVPASSVSYASSILGSVSLDSTPTADSVTADLSADVSDLPGILYSDSGVSPWVWAALAVAGLGLLWYVAA